MEESQISRVIQHLRSAVLRDGAGLTDGQLLEDFVDRREGAALAALVRRHGPMVWGVCRRVLGNHHDAEDAFQATFLVLVRKAASVVPREMVGNWLYGVAHQTALKARATAAKRKGRERQVAEMPEPAGAEQDLWHDVWPLLDEELSRLPDKYRSAIVLCDLEGNTRKEAARLLGVPEGTLAAQVARGRVMLAKRLTQRGVVLSGGALATVLSQNVASAGVPAILVDAARAAALPTQSAVVAGKVLTQTAAAQVCGSWVKAAVGLFSVALVGGLVGWQWSLTPDPREPSSVVRAPEPKRPLPEALERLRGKWLRGGLECHVAVDDLVEVKDGVPVKVGVEVRFTGPKEDHNDSDTLRIAQGGDFRFGPDGSLHCTLTCRNSMFRRNGDTKRPLTDEMRNRVDSLFGQRAIVSPDGTRIEFPDSGVRWTRTPTASAP
jgi:RNA polymerase sigma factor (sigma-70 family)